MGDNSKKISKRNYQMIIALVLCAVLLPVVIYHVELFQLKKEQDRLQGNLEERIATNVRTYLDDVALSESVVYNVSSGTISNDSQNAFENKVAEIVKDTIAGEGDSINDELVSKIMTKVDSLVRSRFSDIEEEDLNSLLNSIEAIVLADVGEYVSGVMETYQNTDNFYSHVSYVSGNYETRIANLEEKLYALQKAYEEKLKSLDSNIAEQIMQLKAENASLKSLNDILTAQMDKLDSESEAGDREIMNVLVKVQNSLTDIQSYDDDRIYQNSEDIIKLYNSVQQTQDYINEAIYALSDSTVDTDEIISTLNDIASQLRGTDAYIMARISESNSELAAQLKVEKEAREQTISETSESLASSISETENRLSDSINESKSELTNNLNATESRLSSTINETNENLTNSLNTAKSELKIYIDAEDLKTREDLANAILLLQEEIAELQSQINQMEDEKLNIVDSTYYEVDTTDGATGINIKVPLTNPNLSTKQ